MHALGEGFDVGTFHVIVHSHVADHGLICPVTESPVQLAIIFVSISHVVWVTKKGDGLTVTSSLTCHRLHMPRNMMRQLADPG